MNSQFELLLKNNQASGSLLSNMRSETAANDVAGNNEKPLISCIMPTSNRAQYIEQSLYYFESQSYPNKELVIVYERDSDLPAISFAKNIVLKKVFSGTSIGEKRNIAVRMAKGALIAQWDDDDIYSSERLALQAQPILSGLADITALDQITFFDFTNWKYWKCSEQLTKRMFVHGVSGGTLVYHRRCFFSSQYPNTSLREDADYLCAVLKNGYRLKKLSAEGHFLYLRHSSNTWNFQTGLFLSENDWVEVEMPALLKKHKTWYKNLQKTAIKSVKKKARTPKVSCIMPTYNRRQYIEKAIKSFEKQNYANKELIIIDDGSDAIDDLIPGKDYIKYHRLVSKITIGEKRNIACSYATGEIIVHFDDDDWYCSSWISKIVEKLCNEVDVTGLSSLYFKSDDLQQAWIYTYPVNGKPWVHGATFGYWKHVWEKHPFSMINIGEDNQFLWDKKDIVISSLHFQEGYIGSVHSNNTSPKYTASERWQMTDYQGILNKTN